MRTAFALYTTVAPSSLPGIIPVPGELGRLPQPIAARRGRGFESRLRRARVRGRRWVVNFTLAQWRADAELARRARFIVRAGFQGFGFGVAYAAFYLLIDHLWGAAVILICSLGFGATPWVMRWTRQISLAGHSLAAIMTAGFAALCCVEGGLQGHAIAWLASVPLCALLMVGVRGARMWALICFAVCAAFVAAEIVGVRIPTTYDPAWQSLVSSAGYLGLILFMFAVGLTFENGRRRAFAKMQTALEQLAASHAQLVTLNREKSEFLGIAAHDLRNPLTTIISYAQILGMEGRTSDTKKFSEEIFSAGTRMRDLIKNLLDANAVEEGRFSCKAERCDLRELVDVSVHQNQINADRKRITVSVAVPENLAARADRSTAVQVLDNLISNAVKYSPFGSAVRVEATCTNRDIGLAVTDEGPGISEEDQARMFGKFMRLSARPTGGEASTGLGLSIVKRLVEAMSGSIECRSQLGAGSTFIVRLPAWEEEL